MVLSFYWLRWLSRPGLAASENSFKNVLDTQNVISDIFITIANQQKVAFKRRIRGNTELSVAPACRPV
jgi:hypothetical protein